MLQGDTSIENGKISGIAPEISPRDNNKIVDATGLILLPGGVDPQVYFRKPGLEHKEDLFTDSLACARGGVTSFLEMPNTKSLTTT